VLQGIANFGIGTLAAIPRSECQIQSSTSTMIFASGPLILTSQKSLPQRDANVRIGPLGHALMNSAG
jgi:hypothetical protein